MLSKSHRFHGHNSLNFVYRNGKTFRGQNMAIKVSENQKRKTYRCAVVVAKKVSKSAVVRNRIRRRIFENLRRSSANITKPFDIVITVFQPSIAEIPAAELRHAVESLLDGAGVLQNNTPSPAKGRAIIDEKEK